MPLDLDSLRALNAVIREGGLTRAAARLHKVPSAVSYQVRKLEAHLGLTLLDREGYRVRLTPAGEAVLAEGRRLLAEADRVEALARQFSEGWEPRLLVIVDGMLPLEPTLVALRTLASERVPTRIQIKVEFLHGVQYRFERDGADLMLVKEYEARPGLEAEALPAIDCVLCVSPTHPLAGRRSISLAELQEHVELSVQDSSERQSPDEVTGLPIEHPCGAKGGHKCHEVGKDSLQRRTLKGEIQGNYLERPRDSGDIPNFRFSTPRGCVCAMPKWFPSMPAPVGFSGLRGRSESLVFCSIFLADFRREKVSINHQ